MSLRHLFFPQTLKFPDTKFNKNISLQRYFLQPTLMVDGLIESGDILTQIWKTGIKDLLPEVFIPKSVLLLGLGGGSNAVLIHKYFPKAKITAIEIDSLMEEISKKYFGVNKINNIEIIISDALDFVSNLKTTDHYDLVLVDCFVGKYIPKKLEDLDFLASIKNHSRFTLINRIHWYEHHQATVDFMRSLSTRFFFTTTHTYSNLIISLV